MSMIHVSYQENELPKVNRRMKNGLPLKSEPWLEGGRFSIGKDRANHHAIREAVQKAVSHAPWRWPEQPVIFIADPHADAEAFVESLLASEGIRKGGSGLLDFELTEFGKQAEFIIGGDCLDKGPSNLSLLRAIEKLYGIGANVVLLAGNHDVRLLMGLRAFLETKETTTEHFFIRMGPKVIPLLKEVYEHYVEDEDVALHSVPSSRDCHRVLFPHQNWFDQFPEKAAWLMPNASVEREITRMRKKVDQFESACLEAGLSLRQIYLATQKCVELFLSPTGEFAWFYQRMQLLHRSGSFLFIHAGLDDRIISTMEENNFDFLNSLYKEQVQHNLFEFYYGPLANTMRTKYRDVDMPLTHQGVESAFKMGVHAVVHGHRNRTHGQRIMLRQGMIHIEGDITLDRNSRKKEGLEGFGIGVTIIKPEGQVVGISNDYPLIKVFEPQNYVRV